MRKKPFAWGPLLLGLLLSAGCAEDWGTDQHGRAITAHQMEGQWLVINYWAEWCGPCRTEIPELNALAGSSADLAVLGVNYDGLQGDALAEAAEAMGIDFRVLSSDPAARLKLPAAEVLPVTFLVDERGELRQRLLGEQTADGLRALVSQLQQE